MGNIVIVGISSDIGSELARRYSGDGHKIIGTYRSKTKLDEIKNIKNLHLIHCDLSKKESITKFVNEFKKINLKWNVFLSLPCNPLPLKAFFECDFDEWSNTVNITAIEQLRVLHQLYNLRDKNKVSNIIFFAAGGINKAVINFSALTISKIMLIKMCEYLDAENKDLNIFSVGVGWTRTKTHNLILKYVDVRDERYQKTLNFMKNEDGTSMDDIYGCIKWLCEQGKEVSSGRNFSVVNDRWKGKLAERFASELKNDTDMYKLRRHRNDWQP